MILSLEKFFFGKRVKISRGLKTEPGNCPQYYAALDVNVITGGGGKNNAEKDVYPFINRIPTKTNAGCPRGNFF